MEEKLKLGRIELSYEQQAVFDKSKMHLEWLCLSIEFKLF